jgi:hypothetical protein
MIKLLIHSVSYFAMFFNIEFNNKLLTSQIIFSKIFCDKMKKSFLF